MQWLHKTCSENGLQNVSFVITIFFRMHLKILLFQTFVEKFVCSACAMNEYFILTLYIQETVSENINKNRKLIDRPQWPTSLSTKT